MERGVLLARGVLHPGQRLHPSPEDRGTRIPASDRFLDGRSVVTEIGPADDNDVGAHEPLDRFTETSKGKDVAAPDRVQRVDQHHIDVAGEPQMLEPVIEHDDVNVEGIAQ